MLADYVRGWEIVPKNEYVAEKRNFEGKCGILKTLSPKDIISWQTSTLEGRLFIL